MGRSNHYLGVDVGGSGIKGAIVDVTTGELLTDRLRVDTPQPATPKAMTRAFGELFGQFDYSGEHVGVGFPAIMRKGVARSAANIDPDWIGTSVDKLWGKAIGRKVHSLNDADAAGLASVTYGKAAEEKGVVIFLTIGTGIGSAMFIAGTLVPNTELGHVHLPNGVKFEHYASKVVRKSLDLSYEEWGARFDEVLAQVKRIFSPDLVLLGGGTSKHFDTFKHTLTTDLEVRPGEFHNKAGAIGAAIYAQRASRR